jgi:hypothetical protein
VASGKAPLPEDAGQYAEYVARTNDLNLTIIVIDMLMGHQFGGDLGGAGRDGDVLDRLLRGDVDVVHLAVADGGGVAGGGDGAVGDHALRDTA